MYNTISEPGSRRAPNSAFVLCLAYLHTAMQGVLQMLWSFFFFFLLFPFSFSFFPLFFSFFLFICFFHLVFSFVFFFCIFHFFFICFSFVFHLIFLLFLQKYILYVHYKLCICTEYNTWIRICMYNTIIHTYSYTYVYYVLECK